MLGLPPALQGSRQRRIRRGMLIHSTAPRPPVGRTPHVLVHRQNKLRLRHYPSPSPSSSRRPPVVVVPSMINRATICDLESDRSLVGGLAALGHDVYLVDWGIPGPEDAGQSMADLVLDLLHRAIDRACRHAGAQRAFLLGYCLGGTVAAIYAALRPARVHGLVALNTPVQFSEGGRLARFARAEADHLQTILSPDRLVPVELMAAAFQMLDPVGIVRKYEALDAARQDPVRLARALARERWIEEQVPMPGTLALELVRHAYQQDRLVAGTWALSDESVDLGAIRCPLLVCTAKRDFIVPMPSALPLAELAGAADVTVERLDAGHIGAVVGRFGPIHFYPLLDRWFRSRPAPTGGRSSL